MNRNLLIHQCISAASVVSLLGWGARIQAATIDDLTWDSSGDSVIITDCDTAATGELEIPEMIDGKPVGAIGDAAFYQCDQLTAVAIPSGVTGIGSSAFNSCTGLKSVLIPDSVTSIGKLAFGFCWDLTSVTIPSGVSILRESSFQGCTSLQEISIPSSVSVIEFSTFESCSSLESVSLSTGLVTIGGAAFRDCHSLDLISIPDSVTAIGGAAFERCHSLSAIDLPDQITQLDELTFSDCTGLTTVKLPMNLHFLGNRTFELCRSLRNLTVPEATTYIGDFAFRLCDDLEGVVLPEGLDFLGQYTFLGCRSLIEIEIPSSLGVIREGTFLGCNSLSTFVMPETIQVIGDFAFKDCSELRQIVFDGDAPSIGGLVFAGLHGSASVFVRVGAQGFRDSPFGPPVFGGLPVVEIADLIGRFVFYNDSSFDGSSDSDAIGTGKSALLPGQQATFANYSSYSNGINGVMVDLSSIPNPDGIDVDDFAFRVGNSQDLTAWGSAPAPQSIEVDVGGGEGGSDRIKIIWPNNVIEKQWLEVSVLSNADSGLVEADVFYIGNAIGDTGNDPDGTAVNLSDENGARQNPRNFLDPAPIDDPYDFNRDGFVTISDENIARQNGTNFLTELVMLDLAELSPTGGGLSRASVGGSVELGAASERVSIRRTEREGEFLIEASLPEGRLFELQ